MYIPSHYSLLLAFSICCSWVFVRGYAYHESEGNHVVIEYHKTHSDNCQFVLFHNNVILSNSETPVVSNIYQQIKHYRMYVHTIAINKTFTVTLRINDLEPSDSGAYLCVFQCNDVISLGNHTLQVYYPPKPAHCGWVDDAHLDLASVPISQSLSLLECAAQKGFPRGEIVCYSRNDLGTTVYSPVREVPDLTTQIKGRLWLRKESNIRCCTHNFRFLKKYHKCKDFVWRSKEINLPPRDQIQEETSTTAVEYLLNTAASRDTKIHLQFLVAIFLVQSIIL